MLWFLFACAGSVSGKVDDEAVPGMGSGFWIAIGGGNNEAIMVVTSTVPNACAAYTAYFDASSEAYEDFASSFDTDQLADDLQAAEEENFPAEHWAMTASLAADPDDEEDVVDEYEVEDNEASIEIQHKTDYTDWENVLTDDDAYHAENYYSEDGTVEVKSFKEEGGISVKGEVDMEGEDGSAGDIKVSLKGSWCEEGEEAYKDYINGLF